MFGVVKVPPDANTPPLVKVPPQTDLLNAISKPLGVRGTRPGLFLNMLGYKMANLVCTTPGKSKWRPQSRACFFFYIDIRSYKLHISASIADSNTIVMVLLIFGVPQLSGTIVHCTRYKECRNSR